MKKNKYISLDDINTDKNNKKNKIKMKKERKSIFERFSTKENIIIFSFLLILFIIIWNLIKTYDPFSSIDYREINSNKLLLSASVEHDRENYWIINDIILSFLSSGGINSGENTNGEGVESKLHYKFSTKEYYETLESDYKIFLNKKEYLEIANKVITNYKNNYENLNETSEIVPIRKIYKINNYKGFNGEYFLVRLNTSVDSYIGIHLIKEDSQFKIFYLE